MTAGAKKISTREHDPRLEAAQKRLRETIGQADAIEAIREIVTNLLGCEEIGLFAIDHESGKRNGSLMWSFGIDTKRHGTLAAFEETILHRVLEGELQVVQAPSSGAHNQENSPLRAFIPIRLKGRTVAVLVMLKLLPQKLGFDEADINLVKLLSTEAGKPLFEGNASANA